MLCTRDMKRMFQRTKILNPRIKILNSASPRLHCTFTISTNDKGVTIALNNNHCVIVVSHPKAVNMSLETEVSIKNIKG